jgi:hypothetical protein
MASWGSSWLGSWGSSWGYQAEETPEVELLGGGAFHIPYQKYKELKEKAEALERQKDEAELKAKELQRQAEAKRLDEEKGAALQASILKSRQDAIIAEEELRRLYALMAIETERLRQFKDEEDALIALMLSLPFNRLIV